MALALTLYECLLLGKSETSEATASDAAVLSVLHPLNKLFTGKLAVASASEVLECFGGAGYVEDTGLPALLRDAQVFPIWEGTTNVLALETLRSFSREDAWEPVLQLVRSRAALARHPRTVAAARTAVESAERALAWARDASGRSRPELEAGARRFALTIAGSVGTALATEHAEWALEALGDSRASHAVERFASRGVQGMRAYDGDAAHALAMGELLPQRVMV